MEENQTRQAITDLLDDGLILDDIAFLHGMADVDGLREFMRDGR
jgi:hypothetical protein